MGESFLPGSENKAIFPNGDGLPFVDASGALDDPPQRRPGSHLSVEGHLWHPTLPGPVSASVSPAVQGTQSQHPPEEEVVGIKKLIYAKPLEQLGPRWVSVSSPKHILAAPAAGVRQSKGAEDPNTPSALGKG